VKRIVIFISLIAALFLACEDVEPTIEKSPVAEVPSEFVSSSLQAELDSLGPRLNTSTGVFVLEKGSSALVTRAWLAESAQETIDIQYFIFSTDNVGLIACDHLIRAADRGVKVRLLIDDILVDADPEDVMVMASHENIEVKIYNPGVNLGKNFFGMVKTMTTDFFMANQRMHNKVFMVDQKVVITGGRNVADEYFDFDHEYNFRDRDALLVGKAVKDVNDSFSEYWDSELSVSVEDVVTDVPENISDPTRFDKLHSYASDPENFWPQVRAEIQALPDAFQKLRNSPEWHWIDDVEYVSDPPGKNDRAQGMYGGGLTTDKLSALISGADSIVDIQSPYLITTSESRSLLYQAVQRGVRVRLLTNSLGSTDGIEAFSGYQRDREKLLATGVELYEFRPDAESRFETMNGDLQDSLAFKPIFGIHAKTMIVDGNITVIGTFNFDPRSSNLNTECITIFKSKELADEVTAHFEQEIQPQNSWRVTPDFNPDAHFPVFRRIKSWTRKIVPKGIL
jgi:putative cardiolipin synthase